MRCTLLLALLLSIPARGHALEGALTSRPLGDDPACPYGYVEYLPAGYAAGKTPEALVVCFHGRGDEGDGKGDLDARIARHGVSRFISKGHDIAAIVLCPQAGKWFDVAQVHQFITYATKHYRVDPTRLYLMGHSAGGSQVWNYSHAHPEVPTAIVPICGASNPANRQNPKDPTRLAGMPVWAFHTFDDGVVAKENTIRWMTGITKARVADAADLMAGYPAATPGKASADDCTVTVANSAWNWKPGITPDPGKPSQAFTMYRQGGHDAWTQTYSNPAVWTWLLAQRRGPASR